MDLFLGGQGHHGFRLKLLITTIISAHLVFTGFMLSAQLGSLVFMLPYVWYWIMSAVTCGRHYYFSSLQKNVWKLRAAEWLSWRYSTPWLGVSCSIPAGPLPWVALASPLVLMICQLSSRASHPVGITPYRAGAKAKLRRSVRMSPGVQSTRTWLSYFKALGKMGQELLRIKGLCSEEGVFCFIWQKIIWPCLKCSNQSLAPHIPPQ